MNATKNIKTEIFVVDNNSTDDSQLYFKGRFNTVRFIWQDQNLGFAKANNIALKQATGKRILFLNPDTLLPEDCLEKCLNCFDVNQFTGALGVYMVDGMGQYLKESKRGFPSPLTSFFKLTGLAALFPQSKLFAKYYLGNLQPDQNNEVEVLSGAFMMADKKVLDLTGSFDEDFFMYAEDIDLSYRIKKANFKNYYFADTCILHFKGESSSRQSVQYINRFYGAMTLFIKKHYGNSTANFYSVIIEITIAAKILTERIYKLVRTIFSFFKIKKKGLNQSSKTLIVASSNQFIKLEAALNLRVKEFEIVGRVAVNNINEECVGDINQLSILVKTHNVNSVIFCTGNLQLKECLKLMTELPTSVNSWFYLDGSKSMVSSGNKNVNGSFIEL